MDQKYKINEKAVMVKPVIRAWGMSKTDKSASEELNARKFSKNGKVTKTLVSKQYKDNLNKITGDFREAIKKYTLPAGGAFEEGFRIVPIGVYDQFLSAIGKPVQEMKEFGQKFADNLENIKYQAQSDLGDLYNPADYPDSTTLQDKFRIEINTFPIPDNFSIQMDQADVDELNRSLENQHMVNYNRSMHHLLGQLLEPIQHMSKQLLAQDRRLFDSLHKNIEQAIEIAGRLNLYGDPVLTEMCEKAKKLISDLPVEAYRQSDIIRNHIGEESRRLADEIADKLSAYDF